MTSASGARLLGWKYPAALAVFQEPIVKVVSWGGAGMGSFYPSQEKPGNEESFFEMPSQTE